MQKAGRTALWHAAELGNASAVEVLLKNGAKIDVRDKVFFFTKLWTIELVYLSVPIVWADCL